MVAHAQTTRPQPEPIVEPAPPSPIDGPKGDRFGVKAPPPPPEEPSPLLPRRQSGQGWLGWSVGSGYGYHAGGPLEARPNLSVSGSFAGAALGHFGLEVGFQRGDDTAFSLQTRSQVVPHQGGGEVIAKQWAHSIFVRGVYLIPREAAQFYVGGMAGGGEGFRFRITAQPSSNLDSSDTMRGGPFAAGPVFGLILPLLEKLHLVVEGRVLAGFPDRAVLGELNLGAQFDLFSI